MAALSACTMVIIDPVLSYLHQLLVIRVGLAFPVCFGLSHAWYDMELWLGGMRRRAKAYLQTMFTL